MRLHLPEPSPRPMASCQSTVWDVELSTVFLSVRSYNYLWNSIEANTYSLGFKTKEKIPIAIDSHKAPFFSKLAYIGFLGLNRDSRQGKNWWLNACPLPRDQTRLRPVSAYVDRLVMRSIARGIENREIGLLIEMIRNRTPYVCCTTIISSCLRGIVFIHFAPIHRNCI